MSKWFPIEEFIPPAFDAEKWYMSGKRYLLSCGFSEPVIGDFSYTKTGKGRWKTDNNVCHPTHFMELPEPPK